MSRQSTLILVPSEIERRLLAEQLADLPAQVTLQRCGIGLVGAGIRTTQLLQELKPELVIHCGIAGSLNEERAPLGSVIQPTHVRVWGIGAGSESEFETLEQMGFSHWNDESVQIGDSIELATNRPKFELLTVCQAAGDQEQIRMRINRCPAAVAEDMESFAVAMSCSLMQIPIRVVRGISNLAGERDKSKWQVLPAMQNCGRAVDEILNQLNGTAGNE